jgi:hypothetical protein
MPGALQAAYGQGVGGGVGGVYPATHPGIPVPTAAGATNTTQFQNKAYAASSYGTNYDSLSGLSNSQSHYGGKQNNYGNDSQGSGKNNSNNSAGLFQVSATGAIPTGKLMTNLGQGREQRYW